MVGSWWDAALFNYVRFVFKGSAILKGFIFI